MGSCCSSVQMAAESTDIFSPLWQSLALCMWIRDGLRGGKREGEREMERVKRVREIASHIPQQRQREREREGGHQFCCPLEIAANIVVIC